MQMYCSVIDAGQSIQQRIIQDVLEQIYSEIVKSVEMWNEPVAVLHSQII